MDIELVSAAALYLCAAYNNYLAVYRRHMAIKKRVRKRRCWMQTIHQERTRMSLNNRLTELLTEISGEYFIHMSSSDFEYLLQKITPIIKKQDTHWRDSIPPKIRLAVTLRYLATGDSYTSLHRFFKISNSLVSRIIPEVCRAFEIVLKDLIWMPQCPEQWLAKTKGFSFPHCVGALDGKHIPIWAPSHTVPEDMNYQGGFSMVLLSLIDNDYSFMYADISQSRNTDFKVFNESDLWLNICSNSLNLLQNAPLSGTSNNMPYVFVTDGTFPLDNQILKPFPGHHPLGTPECVFNQLISQSFSVVDNAFGILSSVFKVLLKPITLEPTKCAMIIRSCILLHNYLIKSDTSRDIYAPFGSVDVYVDGVLKTQGSWRSQNQDHLLPLQASPCIPEADVIQTRLKFLDYIHRNMLMNP